MKLTLNGETYEADPYSLTNKEGMALERATDWTFDEWVAKLSAGSMLALSAFAWVLMRRTQPDLRFDDVEFTVGELANGIERDTPDPTDAETAA